jgi:hypothetical protein
MSEQRLTKPLLCRFGLHKWLYLGRLWAFAHTWHHYKCTRCSKEKAI